VNVDGMKGFAFPPREVRPEETLSVSNLARVVGSPQRCFYSTEEAQRAGYAARPLPPGVPFFFNAVTETELLDTLGIAYGKTLAAGIDVECGVIVTERESLIGQARVLDAYERMGKDGVLRQFLVLESEFHSGTNMVNRTRITFVERPE
jgi:hypothetical protein